MLVPFLQQWKLCRRLKLFKTHIGDAAVKALAPWLAEGVCKELHLSDLLGAPPTSATLLSLLQGVHQGGEYPLPNGKGKSLLWLRLERNGIADPEQLVEAAVQRGVSVKVVDPRDCRPQVAMGGVGVPAIHLVLFHNQRRGREAERISKEAEKKEEKEKAEKTRKKEGKGADKGRDT